MMFCIEHFFSNKGKYQLSWYILDNVSGLIRTKYLSGKVLFKKNKNDHFMIWIFWNIAIQNSYRKNPMCNILSPPNPKLFHNFKYENIISSEIQFMCNPCFSLPTPNVFAKIVFSTTYQWKTESPYIFFSFCS